MEDLADDKEAVKAQTQKVVEEMKVTQTNKDGLSATHCVLAAAVEHGG